jgi:cytochrome P450
MSNARTPDPIDREPFDIHDPEFARDPYPTYAQLRDRCPVKQSELYGGMWLLTRAADVRGATRDWKTFTSSVVGVTAIPVITPRTQPQLPIELDPPLHSRYRALVQPVFTGNRIEELRPAVAAIVGQLLDSALGVEEVDLIADYGVPLSVHTLAAFTGLPQIDAPLWVSWITRMFNVRDRADGARAGAEFGQYIDRLIDERRAAVDRGLGTNDFITQLMQSEVDGHQLTDEEIHSFCTVVFGAGFETTADAIGVMLDYLGHHEATWSHLVADPAIIPSAVEEFVRYASPIQIFGRNAARPVELHGEAIPEGGIVALSFGSANHDPSEFAEPDRCVLDRRPNKHVGFGAGVHLCLGAPLARLEMALTLEAFVARVRGLRVQDDIQWKPRGDRRGLTHLHAHLEPR